MEPEKPKAPVGGADRPAASLRELLRWAAEEPDRLLAAFPGLPFSEQTSLLLLTSGPLRQDLLLSSPLAAQLVSRLPDQEVYLTLKEIGFEDALPMLSLLTGEQLHYVNDLESWNKERFEAGAFLKLVGMIHQCGEDKLARWLNTVDPELLVLLLKELGSVTKFDVSADPLEDTAPRVSITHDGYYHYHPKRQESVPFIDPVLRILKTTNPERYGMILESAYMDLPAEVEEEALRFRSGRLAEKGMPGFEEACEIYRPLSDERFMELAAEAPSARMPSEEAVAPYPVRWIPAGSFFREALAALGDHPETDRIRLELASLGNKVLIAGAMDVTSPESLKVALQKVADTLTLALERLAGKDVQEAAAWLARAWLHHLFRLGVGQAWRLAQRARRLREQAGFPWIDRFHVLADSPLEETLRGLLRPRVLFCDLRGEGGPAEFRDFAGMGDVRITTARLEAIEAMAALFSKHLRLPPQRIKELCIEAGLGDHLDRVKWSHVLQTAWVLRKLTGKAQFRPLRPEEAHRFIRDGFLAGSAASGRGLDPRFTETLLSWVTERTGEPGEESKEIIRGWVRAGAREIEQELAGVDPGRPVDIRFVRSLCIRQDTRSEGQR